MNEPLLNQFVKELLDEHSEILLGRLNSIENLLGRSNRANAIRTLDLREQLNRMEKEIMANATALQRLQDDNAKLQQQLTAMQTAQGNLQTQLSTFATAQAAANKRLMDDIQKLKDASNDPAIAAVADSMEQTTQGMVTSTAAIQTVADALAANAAAEDQVDQPAAPPALAVSPKTAQITQGGTQQFTASQPVTWSAVSGSIDANGLYTAPSDLGITGDVVTAASQADATVTDTATVTIS